MEISHFLTSARIKTLTILCVFFASFSFLAPKSYAENTNHDHAEADHGHEQEKKGFDITGFIFHHIGDAHEFTIWGGDKEGKTDWVGIYLPVILYTDDGLVTFCSSEFARNDDGTKIVEKKGQKLVKYHGKIYYAADQVNDHGAYIVYDDEHHASNKRPLDFSITKNVLSIFIGFIVLLLIFTAVARGYRKNAGKAPKGIQSFLEPI